MKNNNVRKSGLAIAMAAAMGASAGANAAVELYNQDGTSFSLPLNTICCEISEDLMPGDLDYGRYRPCRNPVFWD